MAVNPLLQIPPNRPARSHEKWSVTMDLVVGNPRTYVEIRIADEADSDATSIEQRLHQFAVAAEK
jgi:hypothetical protein